MRLLAAVVSVWVVVRWAGLVLGVVRLRRFGGEVRGEAVRAAVSRFGVNVVLSLVPFYLLVSTLRLRPKPVLVGTVAGIVAWSVVAGVMAAFMQPKERTPETLDMFRLIPNPWQAYEHERVESGDSTRPDDADPQDR